MNDSLPRAAEAPDGFGSPSAREGRALPDQGPVRPDGFGSPVFVLSTGVGVRALFREAEALGRREELRALLERSTTVCRGPKPTAALKREGLTPAIRVAEPFTTAELVRALEAVPAAPHPWVVLHYGERNLGLLESLGRRSIVPIELLLYEWRLPDDIRPLESLVEGVIKGEVGAAIFTSQVQARHLFRIADDMQRRSELMSALETRTIVAAVGPTCASALRELGVEPKVVPEHPKMGPMILDLVKYVAERR
jgi:uroporphyrinogen-III synthase